MAKVRVDGLRELDRALGDLPKATAKGVLRRTLKQSAEPMATLANALAPILTGDLSESFSYSTKLNKRQGKLHRKAVKNDKAFVEGFVGSNDPAAIQQEFGNVNHGPQPSLRPAWEAQKKPTVERISAALWSEIQKSVARADRKAARQASGQ